MLLAGFGGTRADAGIDPDRERPLPWRSEGRLLFITDAVTAPGDDGRTRLDLALRIPGDQLRYLDRGDSLVGQLRLTVEFRTRFGKPELSEKREFTVLAPPRASSGWSPGHLLLQTFRVPPGFHQIIVRLEDLQRQKRGLAYVGRKVPEKGVAEGLLQVRGYAAEGLTVSQPLFVWPMSALDSTENADRFARVAGGTPVLPNPDRTYGLYAPFVRTYFEVRNTPQATAVPCTVVARVRANDGRLLAVADSTTITEPGAWAGRVGFEVATLPPGSFDFEVEIWAGEAHAVARNRFNVSWRK
ncbi:MAG: hypothetical protein ACREOU_08990, partial [Candidatus Eiseniibacteriota bacterium]